MSLLVVVLGFYAWMYKYVWKETQNDRKDEEKEIESRKEKPKAKHKEIQIKHEQQIANLISGPYDTLNPKPKARLSTLNPKPHTLNHSSAL